jgi:Protein of unknown function (DUF4242)
MPRYCLALYVPRASQAALDEAGSEARRAAEGLSRHGIPIRYVRTTYLSEDETCFHLFEADSAEAVAEAARRAGLPSGRITHAVDAAAASTPVSRSAGTRRKE